VEFFTSRLETPLGVIHLLADHTALLAVIYDEYWESFKKRLIENSSGNSPGNPLGNSLDNSPGESTGKPSTELACEPRQEKNKILQQAETELTEYFAGKREDFKVPIKFLWGTDFQKNVWQSLLEIPYGRTWSYSELAEKLKNPQAVRAVGAANGQNPISIIVPCHRVIGKNSSLTGYAGGLAAKEYLLRLEKILLF
jgi:O-6-methylguanine DNA methyltransferase